MHLRTKLTAGVVLATLVTFAIVGYVAIRTSKHAMRDRVDARLLSDLADVQATSTAAGSGPPSVGDEYAVIVVTTAGSTVRSMTGSRADPDTPPSVRIDQLPDEGRVADATGADGTRYRIATVDLGDGRWLVVGAPIDDLQGLAGDLTRRLLFIAVVAGSTLAVLAWWWIRHTTRPIESLTQRADAIAYGDPDRSLTVPTNTAELASLTRALDAMITSVDASLAIRERSEARLREFIANASHELRTPLTSVSGYLQLDLDGALADPQLHRHAIGRATEEAARMARLVGDLQLLTELDEPDPATLRATEPVDITALTANAVQSMSVLDTTRTWTTKLPSPALLVTANHDQLRQVLENLLANIRTHTPPGTTTVVAAHRVDHRVVIDVADNGPGLTDSEMDRAFDRFWRQDPSRSRNSGGSGLGLSIVAAIIHAHNGTVTALRTDPHGLTIRITLPGHDTPQLASQPPVVAVQRQQSLVTEAPQTSDRSDSLWDSDAKP